ncbi:hypothetical protein ACP3WA_25450, partial [Salmonella enterica]|uniref:hypothetical protein n=1 Tax=Salmonella enterica TaxID=28901 RepID=UPI003CE7574A
MWKVKLEGGALPAPSRLPRGVKQEGQTAFTLKRAPFAGLVLGIDPSLRGTGLALIEFVPGRQPVLLRCQTVHVAAKLPMAHAL